MPHVRPVPSRILLCIVALLCAASAYGQLASPPRQAAKETVQSASPAGPRVLNPQSQPPEVELARAATLPADLFTMDDRAIIVVGGRQRQVGEIKRELAAELRRESGPPKTGRSPARAVSQAAMQAPRVSAPPAGPGDTLRPEDLRGTGQTVRDVLEYCHRNPAKISRVSGALTPNGRVTIHGECFGTTTGTVEVIGQFPGGNMKLSFERWANFRIDAVVPPVRGAVDHAVALTVVRADKTRTPAAQASFVAARARVEVPGRHWTPSHHFTHIDSSRASSTFSTPFGVEATASVTPFTLSINPNCSLEDASWTQRVGRVDAFDGWQHGPPHEARVDIRWTPRCTNKTTRYLFSGTVESVCHVDFELKAWAQCPVGVAP